MKPFRFITDENRRNWCSAVSVGLTPAEFVDRMRNDLLKEIVVESNALNVGCTVYVDLDGDLAYRFTDAEKFYQHCRSTGFPIGTGIDAQALIARAERNLETKKKSRAAIREIGEGLKGQVLARYPRLAGVPMDIFPVERVNASAQPVPSGGDAVVLNAQFDEAWVWCEWFSWQWIEGAGCAWVQLLAARDSAAVHRWSLSNTDLLTSTTELATAMMGESRKSSFVVEQYSQDLPEGRRGQRGDFYAKSMIALALLHEFGHVALGHTDWLRSKITEVGGESPEELLATMRRHEYAADAFAARAFVEIWEKGGGTPTSRKFAAHVVGWAAVMLFSMLHHGDGNRQVKLDPDDPDSTHPAPLSRLNAFLRELGIDMSHGLQETPLGLHDWAIE